jgi:hypothetical protein
MGVKVMELMLLRYSSQERDTLGMLFDVTARIRFLCYVLEDEYRENKILGHTRIDAGRYEVVLKAWGPKHERYKAIFPHFHKGMLKIKNTPRHNEILIHIGNTSSDTSGCLLVGDTANNNITSPGFVGSSRKCYERIYKHIAFPLVEGQKCYINVVDFDFGKWENAMTLIKSFRLIDYTKSEQMNV